MQHNPNLGYVMLFNRLCWLVHIIVVILHVSLCSPGSACRSYLEALSGAGQNVRFAKLPSLRGRLNSHVPSCCSHRHYDLCGPCWRHQTQVHFSLITNVRLLLMRSRCSISSCMPNHQQWDIYEQGGRSVAWSSPETTKLYNPFTAMQPLLDA